MKIKYILFLLVFCCISCFKEELLIASADFAMIPLANNINTPAFFTVDNKSNGGEFFEWTFEGGLPASSTKFNPGQVKYTQAGTFTVKLKVSNKDGSVSEVTKNLIIGEGLTANFSHEILVNNFAPVEVSLTNLSQGASTYAWSFSRGNPAASNLQNPTNVIYSTPGNYTINLTTTNAFNQILQKSVSFIVKPALSTTFSTSVLPINADYEAPLTIKTNNTTISATSFSWSAIGSTTPTSTAINPDFVYTTAGNYTIQLTATNSKSTQIVSQNITVLPNTNLSVQNNIKLGINTAQNSIGCFYSTSEKKVYKSDEVDSTNGSLIDIVFFGLNSSFSGNRFISPIDVSNYTFSSIPSATNTSYVNRQETCSCSVNISSSQFDSIANDAVLQGITITNQIVNFNDTVLPRIIPFKTQEGRKGLIKIKSFVNDGLNSYILIDIKVQKQP